MKTRSFTYQVLITLILLISWSCRTDKESVLRPEATKLITISEAKAWYEGANNKNARTSTKSPANRMVYWDGAQTTKLSDGLPVVIAPLFYNYANPIILPQNASLTDNQGKTPRLSANIGDLKITKKIIISKDDQGNYQSCVMMIVPNKENRRINSTIKMETFEGRVLIYNEDETDFLLSMEYNKGRLKSVYRPNSTKGARPSESCYQAVYQSNGPNMVGGSSGTPLGNLAESLNIPMNFMDNGGNFYVLTDILNSDCATSTPIGPPFSDPNNPNEADWIFPHIGGSGGPSGGGPNDGPVPIDEGQPINLGPTDLWLWDMLHRSAGPIYFNDDESNLIRTYPNLTYSIGNYIQLNNQKPDLLNFFNNYKIQGPDVRIFNLKEKLNCFGEISDNGNYTYKATLYVDQPVQNSRDKYALGNDERKVGHTFVGIEKHNNVTNETVRLVFGFYVVQEWQAMTNLSVAGAWGDDGGSQYDVSLTSNLSASQFSNLINTLKSVGDNTAPNYHIVDNNCTTFSYNLLSGVMSLPSGTGQVGFLGTGKNPADMCQDIRGNSQQYGGSLVSGNNMAAPTTTNCN
ncbi:hypothetical protein [Spirosoma endbachense]|uniref:Uncharacterized protein n=1 Tax=Spirosoma endbachense TaxID=2666025 RepID=A0A6P1W1V6_9BACT|nr:hypothetical protein [Spirosoma endbachense]QHV99411.1 hypothetical protein GJR95_32315 [Spirosoma endbachense]